MSIEHGEDLTTDDVLKAHDEVDVCQQHEDNLQVVVSAPCSGEECANNESRWFGYVNAIKGHWILIGLLYALLVGYACILYQQHQEVYQATQEMIKTCKLFKFDNTSQCLKAVMEKTYNFTQIWKLDIDEINNKQEYLKMSVAGTQQQLKYMGSSTDYPFHIFLTLITVIVFTVMNKWWTLHNANREQWPLDDDTGRGEGRYLNILENIGKRSLYNNITIVSFNNDHRQKIQIHLSRTVTNQQYHINCKYIKTTEDILDIHSKVALVFVDSNYIHIILESEQHIGQHLKSLTVQGILKMGGEAIVIYYLHEESKLLKERELYGPVLKSVRTHDILSALEIKGCVLSVYTEFTKFQRDHIAQKLHEYLE